MRILFDLDGCLNDARHRLPLLPHADHQHVTAGWVRYNAAGAEDRPRLMVIRLMNDLYFNPENWVAIGTSRGAAARTITEDWLRQHGATYEKLIMRNMDDNRSTVDYKRWLFETWKPDMIVDDNPEVVELAWSMGIIGLLIDSMDPHVMTQFSTKLAKLKQSSL